MGQHLLLLPESAIARIGGHQRCARVCGHPGAGTTTGRLTTSEAVSSSIIGSSETTHAACPVLVHSANVSRSGSGRHCVAAQSSGGVGGVGKHHRHQRMLSVHPMTPCMAPSELDRPAMGHGLGSRWVVAANIVPRPVSTFCRYHLSKPRPPIVHGNVAEGVAVQSTSWYLQVVTRCE